jgi:hypothetical protein
VDNGLRLLSEFFPLNELDSPRLRLLLPKRRADHPPIADFPQGGEGCNQREPLLSKGRIIEIASGRYPPSESAMAAVRSSASSASIIDEPALMRG